MKPRITPPPQREPVALPFHPATALVDVACLLRTRGLGVRWNVPRRALEIVPVCIPHPHETRPRGRDRRMK